MEIQSEKGTHIDAKLILKKDTEREDNYSEINSDFC